MTADNLAELGTDLQTAYKAVNDVVVKYGQRATPYVLEGANSAFKTGSDVIAFVATQAHETAAPYTSAAYEKVSSLANQAHETAAPYTSAAYEKVSSLASRAQGVASYASAAYEKVSSLASQAQGVVSYASAAYEKVSSLASQAHETAPSYASAAYEKATDFVTKHPLGVVLGLHAAKKGYSATKKVLSLAAKPFTMGYSVVSNLRKK